MSVESYAHKAAKDTVISWLDSAASDLLDDIYACCLDTNWLTPRYWQEYPVLSDGTGLRTIWQAPPTFEELRGRGTPPVAIFDIAVTEYEQVRTGIEIVHKNPPSDRKLRALRDLGLEELLILPARWVLGQIGKPQHVPAEFWAWGGPR